nr:alcohol dehydrogenase catalytic domain-containing protein [Palleronia caenipelagi]
MAGPIVIPVDGEHPLTGGKAPIVMGYEFSGEVVETDAGVPRVDPGDEAVVEPIYSCGPCKCRAYNLCDMIGLHGLSGGGGGFSEHTVVRENMVHQLTGGGGIRHLR